MKGSKWWASEGVLGQVFRTKQELEERIRVIANGATLNVPLSPDEQAFLLAVLVHHHDWADKAGVGVAHLEIRNNPGALGSTRGIWIERLDRSEIDISWVVALKPGGQSSAKNDVAAAARREVDDQVKAVRDAQEGGACPICGKLLGTGQTHVDHCPPITFDSLLKRWMSGRNLSLADIQIEDKGIYGLFADRSTASDWQRYHQTHAQLRLIHAHENLSLLRTAATA